MFIPSVLKRVIIFASLLFLVISSIVLLAYQTNFYHRNPLPNLHVEHPQATDLPRPLYLPEAPPGPPTVDNFPAAGRAITPKDLPQVPEWNRPPKPHVEEDTPLFIGFTRNWRLLQQVVTSYITAGWPPEDIYIIENTGTMFSNRDGLLSLQNPFYMDHKRLTDIFRVNVITTPARLTFAQLQNFYIYTAQQKGWSHYWWSHEDVVAVAVEDLDEKPYKSLYGRAIDVLRKLQHDQNVAMRWFAYDLLELVRTQSLADVGGWDSFIPFYMTDCDMHERLWMRNYSIEDANAGWIIDVDSTLDDLSMFYKRGDDHSRRVDNQSTPRLNSQTYKDLVQKLGELGDAKNHREAGRNTWQARQKGGKGEPFYRDSDGFERAIQMTISFGRDMFYEKWGRGRCDLRVAGMAETDAWRVVKDWEKPEVQHRVQEEREKEEQEQVKEAHGREQLKGTAG